MIQIQYIHKCKVKLLLSNPPVLELVLFKTLLTSIIFMCWGSLVSRPLLDRSLYSCRHVNKIIYT